MKVIVEQLPQFLKTQKDLPKVFLLAGDEPLQMMESVDLIRSFCNQQGYSERELIVGDKQFDWTTLLNSSNALSLFSERKIIDCRLASKSPGREGSKIIRQYCDNLPEDKILMIQMPKIDKSAMSSAWVKAIDKIGVVTQIWDFNPQQATNWLVKRLNHNGFQVSSEALHIMLERLEGNLLACTQEIEKMKLLFAEDLAESNGNLIQLEEKHILSLVEDSSRHTVFDFSNAVIAGDNRRIVHLHQQMQYESQPIPLILWSLNDVAEQLQLMAFDERQGKQSYQLLSRLPKFKQGLYKPALSRLSNIDWFDVNQKKSEVDIMSKGMSDYSHNSSVIWQSILDYALLISGKPIFR